MTPPPAVFEARSGKLGGADMIRPMTQPKSEPPIGDRRMVDGQKIQQLIPATPGWWVQYQTDKPEPNPPSPVAAWALALDNDNIQRIYAVDPTPCDWWAYGDVVDHAASFFYSPEPPPGAFGVGSPGPADDGGPSI